MMTVNLNLSLDLCLSLSLSFVSGTRKRLESFSICSIHQVQVAECLAPAVMVVHGLPCLWPNEQLGGIAMEKAGTSTRRITNSNNISLNLISVPVIRIISLPPFRSQRDQWTNAHYVHVTRNMNQEHRHTYTNWTWKLFEKTEKRLLFSCLCVRFRRDRNNGAQM